MYMLDRSWNKWSSMNQLIARVRENASNLTRLEVTNPRLHEGELMKTGRQGQIDLNQGAFSIVQQAVGEADTSANEAKKNPAAVALGRLGGLKGGKARALKLSAEQRSEIAKAAAVARWKKGTV